MESPESGSASVGLRAHSPQPERSARPELSLLALAGPLAALCLCCTPPDPVATGAGVPFSRVTWKAGFFEAFADTFLLRQLAQEAQDLPPNPAVPSTGSDLGPQGRR